MRLTMNVLRTTAVLLLILRVLAAPLAMRPASPKSATKSRLVARVCAWPVPRAERSSLTASFVLRPRFKGPRVENDINLALGPPLRPRMPRLAAGSDTPTLLSPSPAGRSAECACGAILRTSIASPRTSRAPCRPS
jgi:hypothetical protein